MRNPTRNLAPRGLFLRAQQIGKIFQHHDVTGTLTAIA